MNVKTLGLRKIGISILLGYIIFASLSTMPFVVTGIEHDCTHDEHCPVCIQLQCAQGFLKQYNTVVLQPALNDTLAAMVFSEGFFEFFPVPTTPVTLKVRINT
jgi:hypothetical protein